MKLYMIRHGESTANQSGKHSGWSQVPLTGQGEEDARRAGALIRGMAFDKVCCSDILRARQTMGIALPQAQAQLTPLLREIGVGSLAGRYISDCEAEYGKAYLNNKAAGDYRPYGGENYEMHLDRVRRFAEEMIQSEAQCIAAFCHAGTIRCMLDLVMDCRHKRSLFHCSNGSVSVFEYRNGVWSLVSWNLTELR